MLSVEEGKALSDIAAAKGSARRVSAPTRSWAGPISWPGIWSMSGAVGKVTSGTCFVQSPGMEMWHPNPDFFFQPGGGPILDLGPYYISNLVQLAWPGETGLRHELVRVGVPHHHLRAAHGEKIKVETPTTIHAIMQFHSGAQVTYCASWDVWQHGHSNMELYGQSGTLHVPDPNFFGGEVRMTDKGSFVSLSEDWDHPFSKANDGGNANYRTAGLADMALAILQNRPHRCSLGILSACVDVMTSILASGETRSIHRYSARHATARQPLDPEAAQDALG